MDGEKRAERVAIVGSREYPALGRVEAAVRDLPDGTIVVSGGARGVDDAAERCARARGLTVVLHRAEWQRDGRLDRGAGYARNHRIVADADRVLAFWDGRSRGTTHTVSLAVAAGKPVTVIGPDGMQIDPEVLCALFRERRKARSGRSLPS